MGTVTGKIFNVCELRLRVANKAFEKQNEEIAGQFRTQNCGLF